MDLSHAELRKSSKSASLVKLQSLLDLALSADAHGDDMQYHEDVRVAIAPTGLYEWLIKVVSMSGVISGEDGEAIGEGGGHGHDEHKKDRDKDEKKQVLGARTFFFRPWPHLWT